MGFAEPQVEKYRTVVMTRDNRRVPSFEGAIVATPTTFFSRSAARRDARLFVCYK